MRCRRRVWILLLLSAVLLGGVCIFTWVQRRANQRAPILYLRAPGAEDRFIASSSLTACDAPNLVVVTHGWYESEPWPGRLALAIGQRVDDAEWCRLWYDWRGPARRTLPSSAAKVARDEAGPRLGREILRLSTHWRHVHLIGHSAGAWLVNEAAHAIASKTSATIHITFLDAYVPPGWDEQELGSAAADPCEVVWADHYFTRDPLLGFTEHVLTHAHNVDVTAGNPGFDSHKFPWHWYYATVTGTYGTRRRFLGETPLCNADGLAYGFARSLEAGRRSWTRSLRLPLGPPPTEVEGGPRDQAPPVRRREGGLSAWIGPREYPTAAADLRPRGSSRSPVSHWPGPAGPDRRR